MRHIQFISPSVVDVLIIDRMGSNYIEYCIPSSASYAILPIRETIPIILNTRFMFSLVKRLLGFENPKEAVIFSIVESLRPKIIITFIDNSPLVGKIYNEFQDKICMSIQNGFRSGFKYREGSFSRQSMHMLYGFGEYEKKMLDNEGICIKKYTPIGSLRYGIYKKYFSSKIKQKYDICFISSYTLNPNTITLKELDSNNSRLFKCLVEVCKKFNFTLCVAMRGDQKSENYTNEEDYYNSLDEDGVSTLISNNRANFTSYDIVSSSNISIASISTLGFEALGFGSKVLFGASVDNFRLAKSWDSFGNFEKLHECVLLNEISLDSIHLKLKLLFDMDLEDYKKNTKNSRMYYMNNVTNVFPHELIQKNISQCMINKQN
jgi:surface carbohydrate biosynthesis protein